MTIIYGSTTGNCANAAEAIANQLNCKAIEVSSATKADIEDSDFVILGSSTWGIGEMQDDFEPFLDVLNEVDFTGKKVALFGTGDAISFSDSFVDAMGELYGIVTARGAEVIGKTDASGYDHSESRAEVDGEFVGLALDYDNESGAVDVAITAWVETIKESI